MISNITYAEIIKINCINEGEFTKLEINRNEGKLKWGGGGWKSFYEAGDYIYWDRCELTLMRTSLTYLFNKQKGIMIATQFEFESKDRYGEMG